MRAIDVLQSSRLERASPSGGKLNSISGAIVHSAGVLARYGNAKITSTAEDVPLTTRPDGAVGSYTAFQAARSRVLFQMGLLGYWGSTQALTEINTKDIYFRVNAAGTYG